MCGICGVIARTPIGPEDERRAVRINRALRHRGPDGEGTHRTDHIHFCMRRLSIIDLQGGAQPLYNEDGSIALILNGEIYNYKELQAELRQRGHTLRSGSDAEVLVHLYEERGAEAVQDLRGMFAFALHDSRRRTVLLGRDRVGEKPLYLREEEGRIVFASELKALLSGGGIPFALDPVATHRYFHFLYAPEPKSIVRGVRQLDAGSLLEIDLQSRTQREWRYWSLLDAPPLKGDPVRAVRHALDEVAKLVIRADVPVGVALSGGLDSGAVAALAARAHGPGLTAFSIGYSGRPPFDERDQAVALARTLGIPVHEAELDTDSMVRDFTLTIRERDEPIADLSGYGHRAVMKLAHDHNVPVLLTGYGGDELFFGYDWVRNAVHETARKATMGPRGFPWTAYARLHPPPTRGRRAIADWLNDVGGLRSSLTERARDMQTPSDRIVFYELALEFQGAAAHTGALYGDAMRDALVGEDPGRLWEYVGGAPSPDLAVTDRIFAMYLRSIGLAQGDRLSMAHSVEARVPLVDYRLIETVIGLRKAGTGQLEAPKAWLRAAVADLLPAEVLSRPKRGFQPPIFEWHAALFERYGPLLRDGALVQQGILSRAGAEAISVMNAPPDGYHWLPFAVLVLEVWCREMEAMLTS